MPATKECPNCGTIVHGYGASCPRCSGRAATSKGGPFYQGEPGRCPKCGEPSKVVARGAGGWEEDRECERGHKFSVEFQHANDPGTVTKVEGGAGGRRRGRVRKGPARHYSDGDVEVLDATDQDEIVYRTTGGRERVDGSDAFDGGDQSDESEADDERPAPGPRSASLRRRAARSPL